MSVTVEQLRKVWTEAEVHALPDDRYIHEVVNGELVMRPKNNFQHEDIGAELLMALMQMHVSWARSWVRVSAAGWPIAIAGPRTFLSSPRPGCSALALLLPRENSFQVPRIWPSRYSLRAIAARKWTNG